MQTYKIPTEKMLMSAIFSRRGSWSLRNSLIGRTRMQTSRIILVIELDCQKASFMRQRFPGCLRRLLSQKAAMGVH